MKKTTLAIAVLALSASPLIAGEEPYGSQPVTPSAASEPATDALGEPQSWGTANYTAVSLSTWGFTPLGDGQWSHFSSTGWSQRAVTGNTTTCADLHFPTGARLAFITTFTNDTDASSDITYTLHDFQVVDSTHLTPFSFTTNGAPGIQRILRPINPAVIIEGTHAYVLCIAHGVGGATNQSAGATLWYQLQVSPSPATATFPNDVPTTHPFFRFVEAMAASGITGGCGAGSFCPDQAVTRGQLSVFLATALGLHFPN
jgi:S-layer family protein